MDAAASREQADALAAVFSGQAGGPMEGVAPLVGEMLGVEVAPIDYVDDERRHSVKIGSAIDMSVEDFVSPLDPGGSGVKVSGVGFPADTLAVGTATSSKVDVPMARCGIPGPGCRTLDQFSEPCHERFQVWLAWPFVAHWITWAP